MSEIVKDAIAASLALLEQATDFPVAPFGYGSDISCDSDVAPDVAEVDPFSTLALAEAIVRRLDCPRGQLPDDKDYGISIRAYANRGTTDAEIQSLAGQIQNEILKDDRVSALTVSVRPDSRGTNLLIILAIQPVDPLLGGFTLTLSATSAAILIEEIKAAA